MCCYFLASENWESTCTSGSVFSPPAAFCVRFSYILLKWKKQNILQSFPIDLQKPMHTLTSSAPWGVVKIRSLFSSHRSDVNVGFPERSLDFPLLHRPPIYTANNQKFKFSDCGNLWSDRLNIAVNQALLKILPFLKIIFQTNCNYKPRFSQAQLSALWQWDLPGPHFSAALGARH